MKKIFILILILSLGKLSFSQPGQYPSSTQTIGNDSNIVKAKGAMQAKEGFINKVWADTNAANQSHISFYNGAEIQTAGGHFWIRWQGRWVLINPPLCPGTHLISGSASWSGILLNIDVTDLTYTIGCNYYSSVATTKTLLPANASLRRIDVIYANTDNQVGVLTGVPNLNPVKPQVNPLTQIEITHIDVGGGATVPTCTTVKSIYNENLAGEWGISSDVPSISTTNTTAPYLGSVSTFVPSPIDNSFIAWQNGTDILFSDVQYAKFWVKLTGSESSLSPFLTVSFYSGSTEVSERLIVVNGTYNFNSALLNQWQLVAIPLTGITHSLSTFNKIHFTINKAPASFYLDNVYLLSCAGVPPDINQFWSLTGNADIDEALNYTGTSTAKRWNWGTNNQIRAFIDTGGITHLADADDTVPNMLLIDNFGKIWKTYQPTILADSPAYIYKSAGKKHLAIDTNSSHPHALVNYAYFNAHSGGGGGSPSGAGLRYVFSATAPADTSAGWIDSRYNFLQCFPIHLRVNGAWSNLDTIAGPMYDFVGNVFSRGKPYVIIAAGQSNLVGPYYDGDEANCNYYQGDTLSAPSVAAWDFVQHKWTVAHIRTNPFVPASGANYILLSGKKISEYTGKSVRIVVQYRGGTALDCWAGGIGGKPDTSSCYLELTRRIDSSGVMHPDLFIWAQSEAGYSVADSFYKRWVRMNDSLRTSHRTDSTTLVLAMASGEESQGQALTGVAGDAGLRRLQYDNDRNTKYIDGIDEVYHGIHYIPAAHERFSKKIFASILEGPINPANTMIGYNPNSSLPSPFSLIADTRKVVGVGLNFTNNKGIPFISMSNRSVSYGDPDSSIGGSNLAKLFFNSSANENGLMHYSGKSVFMDGTNFNLGFNEVAIGNGLPIKWAGNPAILGYDSGGDPALYFYTNYGSGIPKMFLSTGGLSILKGASAPATSAALDITSTTKGALLPRMTSAQRTAISSPATALLVFDTDSTSLFQYTGSAWQNLYNTGSGSTGTVTSVAALTLGTTGTDLSSSVANGTTTPVITLNVPTASASNRGALSSTDWSTFNNKQSAITFGTGVQTALGVNIGSAGAPILLNGAGGTPSSLTLTSATGLPLTTGVTGILPVANGGTNASSAGITAFNNITGYTASGATGTTSTNLVFSTSPTLVTPILGTPTSGTLTNCTGLPIAGTTGYGTGVATALAVATNASGGMLTGASSFSSNVLTVLSDFRPTKTITAAGTTGAQTINKTTGTVNFAAGASTLVVTNSFATTTSVVIVTVYGTDATATSARVTKAAGSFTITLNAAATAETAVGFMVTN